MIKVFLILLLAFNLYAYDNITAVVYNNDNKSVKVKVKCTGDECNDLTDIERIKILAIAKLKSKKSWVRIIKRNELKHYNTVCKDGYMLITFMLCNSTDHKMKDSNFGIELLYYKD